MSSMHAFGPDSSESSEDEDEFTFPSTDPNADDEFGEFNPRKRRRTGRNAKESAALGVFGSESEDDGPGKRWKKRNLRGKSMAFVSTGQKTLDEDEDDEDEEDEDEAMQDAEEEEEEAPKAGLGLGFGTPRGLGFQAPTPKRATTAFNHSTPLGRGFVPSSAATPILNDKFNDEVEPPKKLWRSAFDTTESGKGRGKDTQAKPMSFGERMMAKQGWEKGKGLGKEGQGRTGIIVTQLRPQGVGLGAVKEKSQQEKDEERRQATLKGEVYEGSDEERAKKKARRPKISGVSSSTSTPKRVKPKFRTVQEMEKEAPGLKIPESLSSILDMTGPGKKLLMSTSGLMTPTAGSESLEQAESRKIIRRAQSDVSAFVEEWKSLQERKAYNELQAIEQRQEIETSQKHLERVKEFSRIVDTVSVAAKDGTWDTVYSALLSVEEHQSLSRNSPVSREATTSVMKPDIDLEAPQYSETISNIAIAAVHPFVRSFVQGWQPLKDPELGSLAPSLRRIYGILGINSPRNRAKSTTPYETMIHQIVFPKIASAVTQSWDVHDPTPLLALFDAWKGLLPAFVRAQIIDQAVVGKLNDAVSNWKPRKSKPHELPHLWLFPWLEHLPSHHADAESKTGLVTDVKRKFRQLIDSWDFRRGVIPGLQKWRDVLRPDSGKDAWTPLIMNHVLPRIAQFLKNPKNFAVEPQDQEPYLNSLNGVLEWQEILGAKAIGEIIVEVVFPMWHSVLHQWLTGPSKNYEEVGQWFEWWSNDVFPEDIKSLPSIQREFQKGTDMINHALDLGSRAATALPAPSYTRAKVEKAKSPPPAPTKQAQLPLESTFRDKVEEWCQEEDIFLVPERKIMHPQGPLYRITAAGDGKTGGVLVYFKGDRLYALQKGTGDVAINWDEESKDALIGMAHSNVR